jgi:hypothetical protein
LSLGIYGPRDQLISKGAIDKAPGIGLKENTIDVTYVENVVHCMLLGEAQMMSPGSKPSGHAYNVTDRAQGGKADDNMALNTKMYVSCDVCLGRGGAVTHTF